MAAADLTVSGRDIGTAHPVAGARRYPDSAVLPGLGHVVALGSVATARELDGEQRGVLGLDLDGNGYPDSIQSGPLRAAPGHEFLLVTTRVWEPNSEGSDSDTPDPFTVVVGGTRRRLAIDNLVVPRTIVVSVPVGAGATLVLTTGARPSLLGKPPVAGRTKQIDLRTGVVTGATGRYGACLAPRRGSAHENYWFVRLLSIEPNEHVVEMEISVRQWAYLDKYGWAKTGTCWLTVSAVDQALPQRQEVSKITGWEPRVKQVSTGGRVLSPLAGNPGFVARVPESLTAVTVLAGPSGPRAPYPVEVRFYRSEGTRIPAFPITLS